MKTQAIKITEQTQLEFDLLNRINRTRVGSVQNTDTNKNSSAFLIDVPTVKEPFFPGVARTTGRSEVIDPQNLQSARIHRQTVEYFLANPTAVSKVGKVSNLYRVSPHTVENARIVNVPGRDAGENELRDFGTLVLRTTAPNLFRREAANATQLPDITAYNREIDAMRRVVLRNEQGNSLQSLSLFRTAVRDFLTPVFERWHKFFLVIEAQSPEYFAQIFDFFISWDIGELTGRTATAYFFRVLGLLIAFSPYVFTLFPTLEVFSHNVLQLFNVIKKGAHMARWSIQNRLVSLNLQNRGDELYHSLERRARDFINRDARYYAANIRNNSLASSRLIRWTCLSGVFLSVGTLGIGVVVIKNPILLEVLKNIILKWGI